MSIGFAAVTPRIVIPQAVPQALLAFFGTFLTTILGFGLSALMTLMAVVYAWRAGVRLWLDSAVHRARRLDFWPPTPFCEGRANRLGHLLLTAIVLGMLVALILLVIVVQPGPGIALVGLVTSITAPVAVVVCRELISRKVWAASPSECWPEDWEAALFRREAAAESCEQPWQDGPSL
jgi:hypothetical protein